MATQAAFTGFSVLQSVRHLIMAAADPGDPIHAAQPSPRRVHRVRLLGLGAGILSTYLQRWSVHVDCNELKERSRERSRQKSRKDPAKIMTESVRGPQPGFKQVPPRLRMQKGRSPSEWSNTAVRARQAAVRVYETRSRTLHEW